MATNRALQVQSLSADLGGLALVDLPMPAARAGQSLVRIEAAALGFPDLLMTKGLYQAKPAVPFIPGIEGAGTIVEAAPGSAFAAGDRVIVGGLTGAVARYGLFGEEAMLPLPASLSMAQGAALRAAYLTAWVALVRRGRCERGETLLVHGAAGGVGLAAVDLGLALGLRVLATASSESKRHAIAALHPDAEVIDGSPGFREVVLGLTAGRGADLIFDPVGAEVFDESLRCIAFDGRLLVVGFAAGRIPSVGANIPLIKGFSVVGVRAGEYGRRFPERGAENLASILALASSGAIRPHVHACFGLDDWRAAFDAMSRREVVGRSVILPHE